MKLGDSIRQLRALYAKAREFVMPVMRHHITIAIILICSVLMYAVVTVNQILSAPSDQQYLFERTKDTIQTRFDEDTIERIEQLRNREETTSLRLPGGRISPFIE